MNEADSYNKIYRFKIEGYELLLTLGVSAKLENVKTLKSVDKKKGCEALQQYLPILLEGGAEMEIEVTLMQGRRFARRSLNTHSSHIVKLRKLLAKVTDAETITRALPDGKRGGVYRLSATLL